jgi:Mce-associated membrane protein
VASDADAAQRTVNDSMTTLSPALAVAEVEGGGESPAVLTDESQPDGESSSVETQLCADEGQADAEGEFESETADFDRESSARTPRASTGILLALILGLVAVVALGGLAGWFGYGVYQDHRQDRVRNLFLAVGRQGALNLTTIDYAHADADIQRILDSSTGRFYAEFSQRAPAFIEVVKQAQAKTDGSIIEAGLESVNSDSARVLVAVSVTTSNKGATDQQPRHWRMRVDVQKIGDAVKVANVGFVP